MAEVIIINQEEMIKPCNENKNDHYDVISDIISDVIDDVINGVVNKKEEINENEIEKDKYERVFVENVNLRSLLEESQSTLTTFLIENERINGLLKEKKDLLNFICENLKCPISQSIFKYPVIAADGYIYEQNEITKWLALNSTSPMTRQTITKNLIECKILSTVIDEILEKENKNDLQYKDLFEHGEYVSEINKIIEEKQYEKILKYTKFDLKLFQNLASFVKHLNDSKDRSKVLLHIINNTIDLNVPFSGTTFTHIICRHSTPEIIKYILNKNIDLECKNRNGLRPIHQICLYSTPEMVKYIIDKGVDLECETNDKFRPIHYICQRSMTEMVKYIIEKGINLECVIVGNCKPVHILCAHSNVDIIKYILNLNIDIKSCVTQYKGKVCKKTICDLMRLNEKLSFDELAGINVIIQKKIAVENVVN